MQKRERPPVPAKIGLQTRHSLTRQVASWTSSEHFHLHTWAQNHRYLCTKPQTSMHKTVPFSRDAHEQGGCDKKKQTFLRGEMTGCFLLVLSVKILSFIQTFLMVISQKIESPSITRNFAQELITLKFKIQYLLLLLASEFHVFVCMYFFP
jgi:hypothetical protein